MKTNNRTLISFLVLAFLLVLSYSCKKDVVNNTSNTTPTPVTMTDLDGNVYHTVTIGTQTWIVEGLKTHTYRNGDPIPNVTGDNSWAVLTTGAYCDYNNDTNNSKIYGCLYNWYAINDTRNIAPTGWHVATDADWTTLSNYLGGESVAGGKLKEIGTTHWYSPNTGATNEKGFTALPGGYRWTSGTFTKIGYYGRWWSATEKDVLNAWDFYINNDDSLGSRGSNLKGVGYSVRCVKD